MLVKIKCITDEFAYFTQNSVYTVIALDCNNTYPQAFVFDDNGDLRKTLQINSSVTNQWEIVSVEYPGIVQVYP